MKKILLASTMIFGLVFGSLGMASISSAAVATVSAGSSQTITLPTSTVTLTGTATASSGSSIASYNWAQTSGPVTATIATPTTASTTVSGLTTAGSYVFTLTATDNTTPTALTGSASVIITVNSAPVVTVSAGSPQTLTLPVSTTTLTGTASTGATGSSIASYLWAQVSGPVAATIASPSLASTAISGLTTAGVYVFKLTATDNTTPTALTGSSNVSVTVNLVPTPTPKKVKSKLEINGNGGVTLTGELTANNNGVLTVKVWGITFTVNTTGANVGTSSPSASSYAIGDMIMLTGKLDANTATPTINARTIRDVTFEALNKGKSKSYNGWLKSFLKSDNGKAKGHDKNGKND
jgi:hypothetical protein